MKNIDPVLLNRRRILAAALAGGGAAALSACATVGDVKDVNAADLWAGYDERITERTLAEAEKLFGLKFSETERRQILGGAVEKNEDGFFAQQIKSLGDRRNQDIPITLQPSTSFDPRLPGISYVDQDNSLTLYPEEFAAIPSDSESIAFASVKQQAHWMTTGQLSSRELTDIYLERIERLYVVRAYGTT